MAAAGTSNVKMQEVRNGLARLERRRRKPQAGPRPGREPLAGGGLRSLLLFDEFMRGF
jgi:hypothetical protein